jgi:hypothetical protein
MDVLGGFAVRPPEFAAALDLRSAGRLAQCSRGLRATRPVWDLLQALLV